MGSNLQINFFPCTFCRPFENNAFQLCHKTVHIWCDLAESVRSRERLIVRYMYSQKTEWIIVFYCSENPSIAHNLGTTGPNSDGIFSKNIPLQMSTSIKYKTGVEICDMLRESKWILVNLLGRIFARIFVFLLIHNQCIA